MKKIFIILFIFCIYKYQSQYRSYDLGNQSLKEFSKIETISYIRNIINKDILYIENGLVKRNKHYINRNLTFDEKYVYDSNFNIIYSINNIKQIEYDVDTIFYINKYDNENRLIQQRFQTNKKDSIYYIEESYTNFNNQNLPQVINRKGLGLILPFKTELQYDDKGRIIERKDFDKTKDKSEKTLIEKYKYDDYNNIVEIKRELLPYNNFPIKYTGSPDLYSHEEIQYDYNKAHLWIKKYRKTENGEFILVEKRKFKR